MDKKILIGTFSYREQGERTAVNGMIEPLLSYFLPKNSEITLIDGLHPGSDDVITQIEQYKDQKLTHSFTALISKILYPLLSSQNTNKTQLIFKLRDFLATFEVALRTRKSYDLFIGMESIYTTAGIILRTLGLAKKVIYYVSDYSPHRYQNTVFNEFYLRLDRFCAMNADYIWDVSPAMQQGRIQAGLNAQKSAPVIVVQNALFPNQLSNKPLTKRIPYSLVYAGTLGPENGPDIAIAALAIVIKQFPKATLHIYGGSGTKENYLQKLSHKLHIRNHVFFHGFINGAKKLSDSINQYMIGLAPYRIQKDSVRMYGDATKLRLYMGAGIPILTTAAPPLGRSLADQGIALIVEDNEKSLANGIISLFMKKDVYEVLQKKVAAYAKSNTWENTYSQAFSQMEKS